MKKKIKLIPAEKAVESIRALLDKAYVGEKIKPSDYKGPEITTSTILAVSFNIKEDLRKKNIEYHEERGRDVISILLIKLFQMGFQNGEATERETTEIYRLLLNDYQSMYQKEKINESKI